MLLSFHALAQNQHDFTQTKNSNEMMWFNFSSLTWIDAFDSLHMLMAERYPFTEWKAINWDENYQISHPEILQAYNESDTVKHIAALFKYLYSVPDGHIAYRGDMNTFRQTRQAGTFGLNMIPISNGKIVANIVPEAGLAYLAGIRCGDEIESWNGTPIDQIPEMEVYNNYNMLYTNYATTENRLISKYEVLARDSVGVSAEINYISHKTKNHYNVTLISDLNGRCVVRIDKYNTDQEINISNLKAGLYM